MSELVIRHIHEVDPKLLSALDFLAGALLKSPQLIAQGMDAVNPPGSIDSQKVSEQLFANIVTGGVVATATAPAAAPITPQVTIEEVRAKLNPLLKAGQNHKVITALESVGGVKKLSDLPSSLYGALLAAVGV